MPQDTGLCRTSDWLLGEVARLRNCVHSKEAASLELIAELVSKKAFVREDQKGAILFLLRAMTKERQVGSQEGYLAVAQAVTMLNSYS